MTRRMVLSIVLALATGAAADAPAPAKPSRLQIDISVTSAGFRPDNIAVPANKPVTLVFTRKTEGTCVKSVVITNAAGNKSEHALPFGKPVEVNVTFPKAGQLTYACSMDMFKGTIVVQ
jgi:plastocyanin domain-containing protein